MKVLVIHNGNEQGKELVERTQALGCEVTEQLAVWPGFFNAVHQPYTAGSFHRNPAEQPELVIVEGSSKPDVAREVAGYLGETAFTRHIPVYIINHPDAEMHKAQRRAPLAELLTIGQLERRLSEKLGVDTKSDRSA